MKADPQKQEANICGMALVRYTECIHIQKIPNMHGMKYTWNTPSLQMKRYTWNTNGTIPDSYLKVIIDSHSKYAWNVTYTKLSDKYYNAW